MTHTEAKPRQPHIIYFSFPTIAATHFAPARMTGPYCTGNNASFSMRTDNASEAEYEFCYRPYHNYIAYNLQLLSRYEEHAPPAPLSQAHGHLASNGTGTDSRS